MGERLPSLHSVSVRQLPDGLAKEEKSMSKLQKEIRDALSPEAVALIVAYLQPVSSTNRKAVREVEWFSGELVKMLGGSKALKGLFDEVGV